MRVELRPEAQRDVVELALFYDQQSQGLGDYFLRSFHTDAAKLSYEAGSHALHFGLHYKSCSRFQASIYYRMRDNVVEVVAVLDSRRDPEALRKVLTNR